MAMNNQSEFRSFTRMTAYALPLGFLLGCASATHDISDIPHMDASQNVTINPESWPELSAQPIDPIIEAKITKILSKMTLEQKVGQVIQGDSSSVTPEDVKKYRLGSVLSGGNSAPGFKPYADTKTWLAAADAYYQASIDPEGVDIAIPIIWGIDAVHGHTNLSGAIVFPHNIGLGAMRNPDLIERIAQITAHELNVSGHDWTFAPTLAVPQNDRWGRSYEGFSEDPDIVAAYGERIVYGLQGYPDDANFMGPGRVISSAKHFLGDGGTLDGIDQGDANISEAELRDVHGAGYYTSIPAGVQTVMASFNSWQGRKLHGDKALLTDVLKGRLGFNGFVVGDWNGHGQIPGCTNTDCPQSLNAGVDMYMAPDSWKGLYESTMRHVKNGIISMERLDEAVRRILRVKMASGIFEKGKPSSRPKAGDVSQLGLPEHRAIARQAVRESLVLLKNNGNLLPLDPALNIMVIGDGADSITKAAGGWTLSWQGGGYPNSEFPNGQSILSGIIEVVEASGGRVVFSEDGTSSEDNIDVVIAVYGEDPYAEFQGDLPHLDFIPNGFDTRILKTFNQRNIPVVSVFLSGRPLWTNPEINTSDAFIAAWLPGSEGAGISDLLFQTDQDYDFTGKLSFSWPATANDAVLDPKRLPYNPLFPLGYGLTYSDSMDLEKLLEKPELESKNITNTNMFFQRGEPVHPWTLLLTDEALSKNIDSYPAKIGDLTISRADHQAQEDAIRFTKSSDKDTPKLRLFSPEPIDLSRQANGTMELAFSAISYGEAFRIDIGIECQANSTCNGYLPISITPDTWKDYRISLSCFSDIGVDISRIESLVITSRNTADFGIGNIRLTEDEDAQINCAG